MRTTTLAILLFSSWPAHGRAAPPDAAEAAPDAEVPEPAPDPTEEARAEAERIYQRGVAEYNAGRYEDAVDSWIRAIDLLPPDFDNRQVRAELIYNIAKAQEKAFDIDHDVEHLRRAQASLRNFEREIDEVYPEGLERDKEREQVQRVREQIEGKISDHEADQRAREREQAMLARPDYDPVLDERERKANRALLVSGGVITGASVGFTAMMTAGLIVGLNGTDEIPDLVTEEDLEKRRDRTDAFEAGNALAVAGAIGGAATLVTGVTLLAVGSKRERRRKDHLLERQRARVHAPRVGLSPRGAAVQFGVDF